MSAAQTTPDLERWEDEGGSTDREWCEQSGVRRSECVGCQDDRIRELVETGSEHIARKEFGDERVDAWFNSIGWNVEAIR